MGWDTSDLDKLTAHLQAAGPKAETLTKTVVKKIGFDTVAGAQAIVPVDTGNLKNSIGVDFDQDGLGFEAGPTANYAPYVHWGTSRMAPRPFLTPVFDRLVKQVPGLLEQVGVRALSE